jgi:hypothetical protein
LVANSVDSVKDGEDWRGVPDNKIFVIDLAASPPAQIATVQAGKQPSAADQQGRDPRASASRQAGLRAQ